MGNLKKTLLFSLILFGLAFQVHALTPLTKPFGGKIITVPSASCPGSGFQPPFAIIPAGLSLPGLYTATPLNLFGKYGPTLPGANILGNHLLVPIPECIAPPPFNSVFRLPLYGTSLPSLQ